jgi:hypothetical protein
VVEKNIKKTLNRTAVVKNSASNLEYDLGCLGRKLKNINTRIGVLQKSIIHYHTRVI